MKETGFRHVILLSLICTLACTTTQAHHSFPAQYDADRTQTVEGMVTNVEWRNPHVYFYMDVFDEEGNVEEWAFELSNVSAMRSRGWRKETIKAGDLLEVYGARARDNSPLLNATEIKRSDSGEKLL